MFPSASTAVPRALLNWPFPLPNEPNWVRYAPADENFFPIYCEDQDFARRAALSGLAEENCADTNVHHGGSSAILSNEELRRQNAHTQSLNFGYYARKWGGLAGHETFATPFGDPELPLRIAPEDRAAPYGPQHDRTDQAVVLR